ncbi:MAG: hypothetical protein PWP45_1319, partial [Tepidanaerobacteraceae bacterium]|nr:hypothetical protein [Tepidanaerobacteraceae bacterium]
VIGLDRKTEHLHLSFLADFSDQSFQFLGYRTHQNFAAVLWYPHEVIVYIVVSVPGLFGFHSNLSILHLGRKSNPVFAFLT